jgi:hypothetical protein
MNAIHEVGGDGGDGDTEEGPDVRARTPTGGEPWAPPGGAPRLDPTAVDDRPFDYVVVGGGVHGTHVAARLVAAGVDPGDLLLVDERPALLASFREKAAACGMESLRSFATEHLGDDPFDLVSFARARGRDDELLPTVSHPPRPTLPLFLDHAAAVVARAGLRDRLRRARVTGLRPVGDGVVVETDAGSVRARRCVLAIGHGDRFARPDWTAGLPADRPVVHAFDPAFDPGDAAWRAGPTVVVGGGITAAQVAVALADGPGERPAADGDERTPARPDDPVGPSGPSGDPGAATPVRADGGAPVQLCARHRLSAATIESEPRWRYWRTVEERLHELPAGSQARLDAVRAGHRGATIPPYLFERVDLASRRGDLAVRVDEVAAASPTPNGTGVDLRFDSGRSVRDARVVLATGFEPVASNPVVDRVATALDLATGAGGLPVLDDHTLEWRRADGRSGSRIHVVGGLAATSIGPLAATIAGARGAAERLVETRRASTRRAARLATDGGTDDTGTPVPGSDATGLDGPSPDHSAPDEPERDAS